MEYYLVDVSVSCGSLSVVVDRVRVLCNTIFFTLPFYSTARLSCRRQHNRGYRPNATFRGHNLLTRTFAVQSRKCLVMLNWSRLSLYLKSLSSLADWSKNSLTAADVAFVFSLFITVVFRLSVTVHNLWMKLMWYRNNKLLVGLQFCCKQINIFQHQ